MHRTVSLQLHEGFSIGVAAVSHDSGGLMNSMHSRRHRSDARMMGAHDGCTTVFGTGAAQAALWRCAAVVWCAVVCFVSSPVQLITKEPRGSGRLKLRPSRPLNSITSCRSRRGRRTQRIQGRCVQRAMCPTRFNSGNAVIGGKNQNAKWKLEEEGLTSPSASAGSSAVVMSVMCALTTFSR